MAELTVDMKHEVCQSYGNCTISVGVQYKDAPTVSGTNS